jgi:DNA invertase Pin-like site-specific DNA recombinase
MTASNTSASPRHNGSLGASQQRMPEAPTPARPGKIQAWHLERLAIVYVRQSTPQQVGANPESGQRQYALARRAVDLGWPADRVLTIDEDQGRSGATAEGRLGFQRLLAEVSLDHVGLILGLEMSRLARSCRDWHQLLELCAIFRTLLADQDGLYDPTDHNDRLLLGLTGIMSEAELHVLQRRMHEGMRNKARRGELFSIPPIGYIKLPTGEFALDPDEQVQAVVRLVFEQFERLGTVRKVLHYLLENDIRLGVRARTGPNRGQLEWRLPSREVLCRLLHHPIYAGYYCYGRRRVDARRKKPGRPNSGRVAVSPQEYVAMLPDRCPAYISVERYEAVQRRVAENRARSASKGAPREGPSLLAGLIFCARCGRRMLVRYSGRVRKLHYLCRSDGAACGQPRASVAGRVLDQLVAEQVLAALQPGALELSLAAAEDVLRERQRLDEHWRQRLERCRFQAQRAERQYQAVEPENRLVARTLEQQWEGALQEVRRLEEDYARFRRQQPGALTEREVEQIRALARDLPALWQAPTTTAADRQQIIRFLVERLAVDVDGADDRVGVTVTWVGGQTSAHEVIRPVQRYERAAGFDRLLARIEELRGLELTCDVVAQRLNVEGFRPLKPGAQFNGSMVWRILRRRSPPAAGPGADRWRKGLQKGEWLMADLSAKLGIPKHTLLAWIGRGWIGYRRLTGYRAPLVCWADAGELRRLHRLRRTPHGWWDPPLPADLITPKPRPRT